MENIAPSSTSNTSEEIVVKRDNGRNLSFADELIAKKSSSLTALWFLHRQVKRGVGLVSYLFVG